MNIERIFEENRIYCPLFDWDDHLKESMQFEWRKSKCTIDCPIIFWITKFLKEK